MADENVIIEDVQVDDNKPVTEMFDPNTLEFEDAYEFHGYNTDSEVFKNFSKEELEEKLGTYKELGFTQEQLEYVLKSNTSKEPTIGNPREELAKHLTPAEKRNYKAIANTVSSKLEGTELEKYTTDILSNPFLVKIFNLFSNENTPTISKKEINSTPTKQVAPVSALEKYNEFLMEKGSETTPAEKKQFIMEIINNASNKEELGNIFKEILEYL
jgi:DNA-binding transcriptional regulator YhcF (GntR family)